MEKFTYLKMKTLTALSACLALFTHNTNAQISFQPNDEVIVLRNSDTLNIDPTKDKLHTVNMRKVLTKYAYLIEQEEKADSLLIECSHYLGV